MATLDVAASPVCGGGLAFVFLSPRVLELFYPFLDSKMLFAHVLCRSDLVVDVVNAHTDWNVIYYGFKSTTSGRDTPGALPCRPLCHVDCKPRFTAAPGPKILGRVRCAGI